MVDRSGVPCFWDESPMNIYNIKIFEMIDHVTM